MRGGKSFKQMTKQLFLFKNVKNQEEIFLMESSFWFLHRFITGLFLLLLYCFC